MTQSKLFLSVGCIAIVSWVGGFVCGASVLLYLILGG